MSRIGKMPVVIPANVEVSIVKNTITVKGPLWELTFNFSDLVKVTKEENTVVVKSVSEESAALWGTTRAIISNMMVWVTAGYKISLEVQWVWYKFELQWDKLIMSLGFSHKVEMVAPKWVKITLDDKLKNTIHIAGTDKQIVWEFAAKIKAKKKPEPYKGKGIRYLGEQVRRKAGKSGK